MVETTNIRVCKTVSAQDLSFSESCIINLRAPLSFNEFHANVKIAFPSVTEYGVKVPEVQTMVLLTSDNFCKVVEAASQNGTKAVQLFGWEATAVDAVAGAKVDGAVSADVVVAEPVIVDSQKKEESRGGTEFGSDEDFCYLEGFGASAHNTHHQDQQQVNQTSTEVPKEETTRLHSHERPQFNHHHHHPQHHGPPHHGPPHHGPPHHGPPHHREHHHGPPHHGPPHHGEHHFGPPHHRGPRHHRSPRRRHWQGGNGWCQGGGRFFEGDNKFQQGFSCKEERGSRKAMLRFVKHITVEDSSKLQPGTEFKKVWEVRNDSNIAWPEHCHLICVGGDDMFSKDAPAVIPVGALLPGYSKQIGVNLVAPTKYGRYKSFWRVSDANGRKLGQRLWCQIVVRDDTSSTSSVSSSSSSSSSSDSDSDDGVKKTSKRRRERKAAKRDRKKMKKQRKLTRKVAKLKRKLAKAERKLQKKCRDRRRQVASTEAVFGTEGFLEPMAKVIEEVPCAKEVNVDVEKCEVAVNQPEGFQTLLEMGFAPDKIQESLNSCGGDIGQCITELTRN